MSIFIEVTIPWGPWNDDREHRAASLIEKLDYGNFKVTLPRRDQFRHDAHFKCWEAMWEWQGKVDKRVVEEADSC